MNRRKKMNTINEAYKEIYSNLLEVGFKVDQAKILLSQAAHETGNFTSDIFFNNRNAFGLKDTGHGFNIGTRKGHALYESYIDNIKDFAQYYKERKYLQNYNTIDLYVKAIKEQKYFEADEAQYLKGVKFFYNLYFHG